MFNPLRQHQRTSRALFESGDLLPVVFHADDGPVLGRSVGIGLHDYSCETARYRNWQCHFDVQRKSS